MDIIYAPVPAAQQDHERKFGLVHTTREEKKCIAKVEKEPLIWKLFEEAGADWGAVNKAGQRLLHIMDGDTSEESIYIQAQAKRSRRVNRFKFLLEKRLDPRREFFFSVPTWLKPWCMNFLQPSSSRRYSPSKKYLIFVIDIAAALGLDEILALFKPTHGAGGQDKRDKEDDGAPAVTT